MLSHYFSFAWRRIWREGQTNLIRVTNLSIGFASGLVIFLVVNYMLTFDRHHPYVDRAFWVVTDIKREAVMETDAAPRPMAQALRESYPFVDNAVRLETLFGRTVSIPNGKGGWAKKFNEARNICFTEPQYLDMFTVEWVGGDRPSALAAPNSIVLSERYAQKYFNTKLPLGRTLRLDNRVDLTVTGIIKNPPPNTQLRFDALISYATIPGLESPAAMQDWQGLQSMCFVRLQEGIPTDRLTDALDAMRKKYLPASEISHYAYQVLPLADLNHQRSGMAPRPVLYALIAVGLLLVAASCINYINLATAQALQRAREVGVRKVVGSSRAQLLKQFLLETAMLTTLAVCLALLIAQAAMPLVNNTLAAQVEMLNPSISILDLIKPDALAWFIPLVMGVILMAGLYPAWVLSGFNPTKALTGRLTRATGGFTIRRTLITGQFLLTQLFLIIVLVITAQLRHMQRVDWGFSHDNRMTIWLPQQAFPHSQLKDKWLGIPGVESVSYASDPPASPYNRPTPFSFHTTTEPEAFETYIRAVDEHYTGSFGLKILAGRNFTAADTTGSEVLINETLVNRLGIKQPGEVLGKRMRIKDSDRTVVGVVKDFRSGNLHQPVMPVTLIHDLQHTTMAVVTISEKHSEATEKALQATWDTALPDRIYQAGTVNDLLNSFTEMERLLAGFVQIFAFIAIAMNCLGLYGLVTFMAEGRAKEIGIRRILGARTDQLLWVFGSEFSRLLVIGFLFAAPLGWWLTAGWLQQYTHRIEVNGWLLLATIVTTAVITAATVLAHALKAATTNPVEHLRTQ